MTVGENIQKFRKNLGLSQEELGQKLLVSRQTISLWEKDQTMPTIDNLMRLKEVFDVSVDEILGFENKREVSAEEPNEVYRFNFTQTELNEIYRMQRKSVYRKPVLVVLILIFLVIFYLGSSASDMLIGLTCGFLFMASLFYAKEITAYKKIWKRNIARIPLSTYEYRIFDDYIVVRICRNNEMIRESKCYLSEIERIQEAGKWLFFQFGGQSFILRKNELKENSAFYSYMYKNSSKTIEKSIPNKWRVLSIGLLVASLLSIFAAIGLVGVASEYNNFNENMWLFFLFVPIPVASLIFGFMMKSKGYQYKKNIIAGIVMTFLLCIYGSFTFIS